MSPLSLLGRRRDPWWDLEGRAVRRARRIRVVLELALVVASLVLLAAVWQVRGF